MVREELYRRCPVDPKTGKPDPEEVHGLALEMMNRYVDVLAAHQECFDFPELEVRIKNLRIQPIGTAAGLDKNGDALIPFSYVFDFQKLGTVLVDERIGNDRPRIAVDDNNENAFNAQGFPSRGKKYVLNQLINYQMSGAPRKPIILSFTGLPHVIRDVGRASFVPNKNRVVIDQTPTTVKYKEFAEIQENEIDKAIENSFVDLETLLAEFESGVDGFEYNIFSPNTGTLKLLRTPEIFKRGAEVTSRYAGDRLTLAKMGPYEPEGRDDWLALVDGWRRGGGAGITAVNTHMVAKDQVPSKEWGYPSAGKSGRHLRPYRLRAIDDARRNFPDIIIFATGGISDADDAYETLMRGANAIEGYTPFAYYGLGLKRKLANGILRNLKRDGFKNMQELQDSKPWKYLI